jgi:hypothetical protein
MNKPTLEELDKFICKNFGYGSCDEMDDDSLLYSTRENGDVGEEEYSEEDYNALVAEKKILLKKFDNINVSVSTCDEWVMLNVKLKNNVGQGGSSTPLTIN